MCQRVSSLLAKGPNFSLVSSSVIVYLTALVIYVFALRILFVNFVSFFVSILFFSCTLGGWSYFLVIFCTIISFWFYSVSIFPTHFSLPSFLLYCWQSFRYAVTPWNRQSSHWQWYDHVICSINPRGSNNVYERWARRRRPGLVRKWPPWIDTKILHKYQPAASLGPFANKLDALSDTEQSIKTRKIEIVCLWGLLRV